MADLPDAHLGKLPRNKKVMLCIDMTDGITKITLDGIKTAHPNLTEKKQLAMLRARLEWAKSKRLNSTY